MPLDHNHEYVHAEFIHIPLLMEHMAEHHPRTQFRHLSDHQLAHATRVWNGHSFSEEIPKQQPPGYVPIEEVRRIVREEFIRSRYWGNIHLGED